MPSILEQTNAIEEYLNGDSMGVIGERYGVSKVAVRNYLKKHNVEMRKMTYIKKSKYNFNEHWLDKLDCQEKFYFLGFFAADGNLDDKNSNYRVRIKLQRQDRYLLERFNELFENDTPIEDKDYSNKHNKSGAEHSSEFRLGSKYLFNKISELGFPPRKSTIIKFPDYIPEEYLGHFIRGYFDGDGSINLTTSKGGTKRATITIVGSNYFIPELQSKLRNKNVTSFIKPGRNDTYCLLDIDRQEDIKPFLDWIYKDSKIHLKRKYERYLEFLNGRDFNKEDEGAKRRRIKELEPLIIQDRKNGVLIKDIMTKYNISNPTYYKILKRNNITN